MITKLASTLHHAPTTRTPCGPASVSRTIFSASSSAAVLSCFRALKARVPLHQRLPKGPAHFFHGTLQLLRNLPPFRSPLAPLSPLVLRTKIPAANPAYLHAPPQLHHPNLPRTRHMRPAARCKSAPSISITRKIPSRSTSFRTPKPCNSSESRTGPYRPVFKNNLVRRSLPSHQRLRRRFTRANQSCKSPRPNETIPLQPKFFLQHADSKCCPVCCCI